MKASRHRIVQSLGDTRPFHFAPYQTSLKSCKLGKLKWLKYRDWKSQNRLKPIGRLQLFSNPKSMAHSSFEGLHEAQLSCSMRLEPLSTYWRVLWGAGRREYLLYNGCQQWPLTSLNFQRSQREIRILITSRAPKFYSYTACIEEHARRFSESNERDTFHGTIVVSFV